MEFEHESLDVLPDEMVQEIIGQLGVIRSYDTQFKYTKHQKDGVLEANRQYENQIRRLALYNLCLTSRRLRRLANPILYASFIGTATEHGTETLQLWRERVLDRSGSGEELNKYLKYVEIRRMDKWCQNDNIPPHIIAQHYLTVLADVVKQAPNLQHLSIENIEDHERSFWKHLVLEQDTSPSSAPKPVAEHVFSKLRTLCVHTATRGYYMDDRTMSFPQICPYISTAPMLNDFRACGVASHPSESMPQLGCWNTLQRLEITECFLEIESVASVLSACEGLRHVVCTWNSLEDVEGRPSDLYASLLRHAETLEFLHLDLRELMFRSEEDSDSNLAEEDEGYADQVLLEPLGTLRPFERLSELILSQNCLLGVFPPYGDFPESASPIAELLSRSITNFTMLLGYESLHRVGYKSMDESSYLWDLVSGCRPSDLSLQDLSFRAKHKLSEAPELTQAFLDVGVRYEQVMEQSFIHEAFR